MKNKIIIEGDIKLEDWGVRNWVSKLDTKIDTVNERTKNHTLQIRELEREIKKLKGGKDDTNRNNKVPAEKKEAS